MGWSVPSSDYSTTRDQGLKASRILSWEMLNTMDTLWWNVKIAIENGPFIVDLPTKSGDFP